MTAWGTRTRPCVAELEWGVGGLCIFITCDIAGQPEVGGIPWRITYTNHGLYEVQSFAGYLSEARSMVELLC